MTYAVVLFKDDSRRHCRAKDPAHCRYHTKNVKTHMVFENKAAADKYFEELDAKTKKTVGLSKRKTKKAKDKAPVCDTRTVRKAGSTGSAALKRMNLKRLYYSLPNTYNDENK